MTHFTPLSAAIGGALIGLAVVFTILVNGRVAGITGILDGAITGIGGVRGWRIAFVVGLIGAALLGGFVGYPLAKPVLPPSWIVIVVAGLLVGFGTRLANGCTSGHGVCGIARISPRSMVATGVFMATAMVVVALSRHLIGG